MLKSKIEIVISKSFIKCVEENLYLKINKSDFIEF